MRIAKLYGGYKKGEADYQSNIKGVCWDKSVQSWKANLRLGVRKDENGNYIIASVKPCSPGSKVTVLIKRGALYFNTVFAAAVE